VAAIAGDLYFGYFLAIRQMLFVVTPLALLSAAAVESQPQSASVWVGLVLFSTLVAGDIAFLRRPREDWNAAAKLISGAPDRGACVVFVPGDSSLYEFFDSRAAAARCTGPKIESTAEIDVAVNPYDRGELPGVEERLRNAGFSQVETRNSRRPQILVYRRR
jgi:hypothetical protein